MSGSKRADLFRTLRLRPDALSRATLEGGVPR
jgi:hypothetical protein